MSKILRHIKKKSRLVNLLVLGFLRVIGGASMMAVFVSTCHAEVIFKRTDKDGLPIFSDRYLGAPERVTISPVNSITVLQTDNTVKQAKSESEEDLPYEITVESPLQNHTYRNNEAVLVAIDVSPKLRRGGGHRIVILVDGSVYKQGQTGKNFRISGVERGAHQIVALVTDITGRELARSKAKTFFVQKASIINRARLGN